MCCLSWLELFMPPWYHFRFPLRCYYNFAFVVGMNWTVYIVLPVVLMQKFIGLIFFNLFGFLYFNYCFSIDSTVYYVYCDLQAGSLARASLFIRQTRRHATKTSARWIFSNATVQLHRFREWLFIFSTPFLFNFYLCCYAICWARNLFTYTQVSPTADGS